MKQVTSASDLRPSLWPTTSCGKVGSLAKSISPRKLPAPALDLLLDHHILSGDVQRGRLVAMNDDPVGALDGLGLDLWPFDRAQMHPGLDPALEEYMVDGVRRTHYDIGAIDRVLGQRDGSDFDAKQLAHGGGEGFAVLWI